MPMSRPHVLLFMCDQMQAPRPEGGQMALTPALDALAADGIRFTSAYCSNAQCVPSRVSLQTGLYPHEAEVMIIYGFHGHTAHLDGAQLTSGQVFRDAGYTTAYFGKTHFGATLASLGYQHGTDRRVPGANSVIDAAFVRAAIAYLRDYDPSQPLFLTVSINQPHPPFELIPAFAGLYPVEQMRLPESYFRDDLSTKPAFQREHALDGHHGASGEAALQTEIAQYCSMISNVDRLFQEVQEALRARGMWDETVALFTSDHGDMMGAHRTRLKGTLPYEELYNVPMILRLPGGPRGQVVDDLVVNTAAPGTLIEAAGLPVPHVMRGGSLLPCLQAAGARQERSASSSSTMAPTGACTPSGPCAAGAATPTGSMSNTTAQMPRRRSTTCRTIPSSSSTARRTPPWPVCGRRWSVK